MFALRLLPRTAPRPCLSRAFSYESISLSQSISLPPVLSTHTPPPASEVTVSRLRNGVTVASNSCYSPLSQISIAIRAGSRYQSEDNLGVAHFLLHNAFLTNSDRTGFRVTRELERIGASLRSELTRELLIFSSVFTSGYAETVLENLTASYNSPEFRRWEVSKERVLLDLDRLHIHFESIADDALHKLTYRTGLGSPVYTPECRTALVSPGDMLSFYNSRVNAENTFVVGTGIEHRELSRLVNELLAPPNKPIVSPEPAKYYGKGETHVRLYGEDTQALLTTEGVSAGSEELPKYLVLQHLLGIENVVEKGNLSTTRFAQCAAKFSGAALRAVSINHSDTGLFGLHATAPGKDIRRLVEAALSVTRDIAKNGVGSDEMRASKKRATSAALSQQDDLMCCHDNMVLQIAMTGGVLSASDVRDKIDRVTPEEVQSVARKISSSKPNLVVTGNLVDPPYLDRLI